MSEDVPPVTKPTAASSWRWPLILVIGASFLFGAVYGIYLVRNREAELGRGPVETKLKIITPPQFIDINSPGFHNFKTRIRRDLGLDLEIEVAESNLQLLLKALRSAPGTYDAGLLFHYQIRPLRHERRLDPLFLIPGSSSDHQRIGLSKQPSIVAPDFRILPEGRDLRTALPLFWGFLEAEKSGPGAVWATSMSKAIGKDPATPSSATRRTLWVASLVAIEGGQWEAVRELSKALLGESPSLMFSLVQASPGRSTLRWPDESKRDLEDLERWNKEFDPSAFRDASLLDLEMPSDEVLQALDENREPSKLGREASITTESVGDRERPGSAHDDHEHHGHSGPDHE